jgi:CTD small phosphatase-like protein 2
MKKKHRFERSNSPPKPLTFKYTLVLDLDETLVHYKQPLASSPKQIPANSNLLIRPHAHEFLKELNKFYRVIVFTAASKDYAEWVLDQIDP